MSSSLTDDIRMEVQTCPTTLPNRFKRRWSGAISRTCPGKGKPQQRDDNPYIPPAVRTVNQMLKDNGFAPRWIEVDKEIRAETENAEKLIENLKGRRSRLEAQLRAQPLKRDAIRSAP